MQVIVDALGDLDPDAVVISDSHRFLFVHIPKTAGKSIAAALAPEASAKHPLCLKTKHETVESFMERHGSDVFYEYYSFCVVRHPLDRLISHFSYLKAGAKKFPEMVGVPTIEAYVEAIETGDQLVIRKKERVLPQNCYVKLGTTAVAVTQVIRFEDLSSSFSDLCGRLRLPARELPMLNRSERQKGEISIAVKQFVERYYRPDFEIFGY